MLIGRKARDTLFGVFHRELRKAAARTARMPFTNNELRRRDRLVHILD